LFSKDLSRTLFHLRRYSTSETRRAGCKSKLLVWLTFSPPNLTSPGVIRRDGGAGGIRTLDRALQPYNGLANRRLQPLGHSSIGGGYAPHRGEPQAADCGTPHSGPVGRADFQGRVRFACLLCNICQKPRPQGFSVAVFMLRVQEASVTFGSRRRGAPEVVRSRVVRRNSRSDAGEARALRD
jgi:hypothetical protein